ncbi:MAG: CHAD domain-containing protein [Acidobacteriia bacterium]|nr:CHAD domain-containing protein [Terriglobia bacterium]
MGRVRKELDRVCSTRDPDAIHDLRVAIRRCRSLAAALQEADPTPGWKQLRKVPVKLFRELGAWRDAQVLEDWVRRLAPDEEDPARVRLLEILEAREHDAQAAALRAAERFDAASWKRLERALRRRVQLVPPDGPAAQCLALERFEAAHELHARALRTEMPKPWHVLRIGLKKFRYTAENLLPQQYAGWEESLKRAQDLLGDVHDLDVLADLLKGETGHLPAESAAAFRRTQEREREERLQTYRQLTLGRTGLWHTWRSGLPQGAQIEDAAQARLRVTARALDPRRRRTSKVSRLALRISEALAAAGATPLLGEAAARRILHAAAHLHGIGGAQDRKPPHKAARALLQKLPAPPGWSNAEWELLAETVRYHRGAEPKPGHRGFAALSEEQQRLVRLLAGLLRVARALRRCGVEAQPGLRAQSSGETLVLRVPRWANRLENVSRLAAGKHLLEQALGRPLLIEPVEKAVPFAPETENAVLGDRKAANVSGDRKAVNVSGDRKAVNGIAAPSD